MDGFLRALFNVLFSNSASPQNSNRRKLGAQKLLTDLIEKEYEARVKAWIRRIEIDRVLKPHSYVYVSRGPWLNDRHDTVGAFTIQRAGTSERLS